MKILKIIDLKDEPQYLNTLAGWHQHEWADLNPGETLDMRIHRMQDYLNDNFIPTTFIAKQIEVVGSAAIVANDMDSKTEFSPWLASVFVAPDYRHQNIGSRLVQHVMMQAKQRDIETLYLFTADNEKFYSRLGWNRIKRERYHGAEISIMSVPLNNR